MDRDTLSNSTSPRGTMGQSVQVSLGARLRREVSDTVRPVRVGNALRSTRSTGNPLDDGGMLTIQRVTRTTDQRLDRQQPIDNPQQTRPIRYSIGSIAIGGAHTAMAIVISWRLAGRGCFDSFIAILKKQQTGCQRVQSGCLQTNWFGVWVASLFSLVARHWCPISLHADSVDRRSQKNDGASLASNHRALPSEEGARTNHPGSPRINGPWYQRGWPASTIHRIGQLRRQSDSDPP